MNSDDRGPPIADAPAEGNTTPEQRDRKRLDEAKAHLASIPLARRGSVAKRALALHLQRRAGQGPSTYLAHLFKTPMPLSTKGADEIV